TAAAGSGTRTTFSRHGTDGRVAGKRARPGRSRAHRSTPIRQLHGTSRKDARHEHQRLAGGAAPESETRPARSGKEAGLHEYGSPDTGAGHWREQRRVLRNLRGAASALAVSECGPPRKADAVAAQESGTACGARPSGGVEPPE